MGMLFLLIWIDSADEKPPNIWKWTENCLAKNNNGHATKECLGISLFISFWSPDPLSCIFK